MAEGQTDASPGNVAAMAGRIREELATVLGLKAIVRLLAPGSIVRSEGKAKRVIDNRIAG